MEQQVIECEISPEGEVTIHVEGSKGKKCLDITKDIEKALGSVNSRKFTGEAHQNTDKKLNRLNQYS